jgi:hypothetical protein
LRSRLLWLGAAIGLLGAAAAPSVAASAATSPWQVVKTTNPQAKLLTDSFLSGVSVKLPADGWAVGQFDDSNALVNPLVERWNGTRWNRVVVPEPAGRQADLLGVDQLSATDAWAVGESGDGGVGSFNIDQQPLIEHWNGAHWTLAAGASLAAGNTGVLNAVGGTGPADVWAVGSQVTSSTIVPLFEHYNGKSWTIAAADASSLCDPSLADCFFSAAGVAASSPSDVWVVGNIAQPNPTVNVAAHWNGKAWTFMQLPALHDGTGAIDNLSGVTVISPTDVWASGYESNANGMNFHVPYVLHWNGTAWSLTKTPNRGTEGSLLRAITSLSATDVWAVGQVQLLDGTIRTLTEQFNGTKWTVVPSPSPGGVGNASLDAVSSPSAGTLLAAGAHEIKGQCCLRTLGLMNTSG